MFPTCSKRLFAGRNALSATARTTIALLLRSSPSRSWASRGDLDSPPVHQRPYRPPARLDLPLGAPRLPDVLVGDGLPLVVGGLAGHVLETGARPPLAVAALGGRF